MLPIEHILPELKQTLNEGTTALLQAPPGAGKTTKVPLALLDAPWRENRKILMLEPRRLAARSAARYMAKQLGEAPGQTVGYRTRQDTKVSGGTRIEVVTEGILTRLIQNDPMLEDYAAVLFDEFHVLLIHHKFWLSCQKRFTRVAVQLAYAWDNFRGSGRSTAGLVVADSV